nr:hypothetical protein [uncultured Blautia sp.]
MGKKKLVAFLSAIAVITGVCGTYAAYVNTVKVDNHISTGLVDISLDEFQEENGKLIAYENNKTVLPGEQVSKIPRITNKGEPCYVRAKISYDGNTEELEGLSDENISGFSEDWVKKGEYFYYTKILESKEGVELFDTVSIPADWTEAHEEQELSVSILTEAVQSANFKPDFSAMSPWGNQVIELAVKEQDGEILDKEENVKLTVEFNGKAHKLIAAPKDFFSNFSVAMPGDVFTDSVDISNTTDQTAELFFCTASDTKDPEEQDLLNKLGLEISYKGKQLYSGNLKAEELSKEYISLGKYRPDETGKLDFKVTVPKELNNIYALRNADVQWIFTVREDQPAGAPQEPSDPAEHSISTPSPVKTGDETPVLGFICCGIAAGFVIVAVYIRKRGGKK